MATRSASSENEEKTSGGRIPPQDLSAEKSLLGALLLSDTDFPEILEHVKEYDFYDKNNAAIYKAMVSLYNNHRPIDLLTLTSELRAEKTLKSVGGAPYLTELTNFVPTAANINAYAEIVADCGARRRLIQTGTKIAEEAYDTGKNTVELVGEAEKSLFAVSNSSSKKEYASLEELSVESFERLEKIKESGETISGLKTGFRDIDAKTGGLQKGDLIVIGARPGMGKTTIGVNIAYNSAQINHTGSLFFSLEMAGREISDRIVSDVAEVNSFKIRTGNLSGEEFDKVSEALSEISEVPFYVDDTAMLTILEMRNRARRAANDHDIGLIVIDYLQLMHGSDRYAGNRVLEITEISNGLKQLARELDVPVVALAQLSRNVTGRDDPRPVLSDLRDSGSIEQDADLVMMLHRPDYYHENEEGYEKTNVTELLFQKHRHGSTGKVNLYFDEEYSRFLSLDTKHEE